MKRYKNESGSEKWLILAYLFNIDGKAASQTITDRIPLFLEEGILMTVLSGPIGKKDNRFRHIQTFSFFPSGLQYELRFLLKKNRSIQKTLRKLLKALVTLFLLPFYLLERIVIHLDTHWSWGIGAFLRGIFCLFHHRPDVLYSTAGPATTHLAAYFLHKISGIPWVAEIHDPLVYDNEKIKLHQRYLFKNWIEKKICQHAAAVIYFTRHALESANQRHPIKGLKIILRPGAAPPATSNIVYAKREKIHFGHFGSLATTRNLSCFIEALFLLFQEHPDWQQYVVLDVYGSGLDDISQKALRKFPMGSTLQEHGRLEYDKETGKSGRQQVIEAMKRCDILLILHGSGQICEEYIPSKVYEYLLMNRPILALTPQTSELGTIVLEGDHQVAAPDDAHAIKDLLAEYILKWIDNDLLDKQYNSPYTIKKTVDKLLAITRQVQRPLEKETLPPC